MDVIKCSLPKLTLDFVDNKDHKIEKVITQDFLNRLDCNSKEIICVSKYDEKCLENLNKYCHLFIESFIITILPGDIYRFEPIILNSTGTITYNWQIMSDETFNVGYTSVSPIVEIIHTSNPGSFSYNICLDIKDADNCLHRECKTYA